MVNDRLIEIAAETATARSAQTWKARLQHAPTRGECREWLTRRCRFAANFRQIRFESAEKTIHATNLAFNRLC
jgi:hypothetical protein